MPKLNQQQLEALEAYSKSKKSIVIQARAGSGKTSFLVALSKLKKTDRALYISFTNAAKDELINRQPSLNGMVKTTYSIGFTACKRIVGDAEVDGWKYKNILRDIIQDEYFQNLAAINGQKHTTFLNRNVLSNIQQNLNLCLMNLAFDGPTISAIVSSGQSLNQKLESYIIQVAINIGLKECHKGNFDFADMLSFPFSPGVDTYGLFDTYPIVMVDEAQDLSPAQLRILYQVAIPGKSQVVAVGDDRQTIFMFGGSTGTSLEDIANAYGPVDRFLFPMCYRCPVEVLDHARQIVPDIIGLNRPGLVENVTYRGALEILAKPRSEVMAVSRVNKSLLPLAIDLMKSKVAFRFNRDAVEQSISAKISFYQSTHKFEEASKALYIDRLICKGNKNAIDIIDCVELLVKECEGATKWTDIINFTRKLFTNKSANIVLGTVHSFKGMEADTVIVVDPYMFPHPLAEGEKELWQENNCYYVAVTRAKQNLYFIGGNDEN